MAKKSKSKEELLKVRAAIKRKKPKFIRQDAHKKDKLEEKWRKPRGLHSKMRLKKRGYRRSVTTGYKSPKSVRGLTKREKLLPMLISSKKDLEAIDPKKHAIILSSSIGMRKKALLVQDIKKTGFTIINVKDTEKFLTSVKSMMDERKKGKESRLKQKEEKLKEKKKKADEKEKKKSIEEKVETDDEKKERETKEKKEMDKILATKQ